MKDALSTASVFVIASAAGAVRVVSGGGSPTRQASSTERGYAMIRVLRHAFALRNCSTVPFTIRTGTLHFLSGGLAICMLSVISACTTTINTKFTTFQYANVEPSIDLAIELNITEAFREYVWHFSDILGLEPMAMPLNGVLADNALAATRAVFRTVTLAKEGASSLNRPQGKRQAVLTPRVASINRFPPWKTGAAWTSVEQIVSIEWTLKTPEDVIVWVGTATGRFTNKVGTAFSAKRNMQERLREAIDNAFTNSVKIMVESPEIIEYAEKM